MGAGLCLGGPGGGGGMFPSSRDALLSELPALRKTFLRLLNALRLNATIERTTTRRMTMIATATFGLTMSI